MICFTLDYYAVSDWQGLNTTLLAQKDVEVEEEEVVIEEVARPGQTHDAEKSWGKCYLRKIHQAEPTTRIRLPPSVEMSSMLCFP